MHRSCKPQWATVGYTLTRSPSRTVLKTMMDVSLAQPTQIVWVWHCARHRRPAGQIRGEELIICAHSALAQRDLQGQRCGETVWLATRELTGSRILPGIQLVCDRTLGNNQKRAKYSKLIRALHKKGADLTRVNTAALNLSKKRERCPKSQR